MILGLESLAVHVINKYKIINIFDWIMKDDFLMSPLLLN